MRKKRGVLSIFLAAVIALVSGCGSEEPEEIREPLDAVIEVNTVEPEEPYILFLNSDPGKDGQWQRLGAIWERRTGIPVTIESVEEADYSIALQEQMAGKNMPVIFLLPDTDTAYAWDHYTEDLSETGLSELLKYSALYLYYQGKAAGVPDSAQSDRRYFAINARAPEAAKDAAEAFLTWVVGTVEGQSAFQEERLYDCYG